MRLLQINSKQARKQQARVVTGSWHSAGGRTDMARHEACCPAKRRLSASGKRRRTQAEYLRATWALAWRRWTRHLHLIIAAAYYENF